MQTMEKKIWKVIGFWAMGLLLFMSTLIIIRWAVEFVTWSTIDAGWAQAIGTIAAIGGAVGIFKAESAIRHRESKAVAVLAASKFGWHAFYVALEIDSIVHTLKMSRDLIDLGVAELERTDTRLQKLPDWPLAELSFLAPLSDNSSFDLANGMGRLNFARPYLSAILADERTARDQSYRAECTEILITSLDEARHFFDRAASAMQIQAAPHTGVFSPETQVEPSEAAAA